MTKMDDLVPVDELIPPPTELNDSHKVYSIAVVCIVLCIVTTFLVLVRLGYRIQSRTLGADDYATIPSVCLYIGWTALAAYMNLNAGVGKPLWEITVAEYSIWFRGIIATAWLYPAMSGSIRASILLFYLRIFSRETRTWVRSFLLGMLVMQGVYVVVFSIMPGFVCRPLHYAWVPSERVAFCNDFFYSYMTIALYLVSLVFDVVLLVFPVFPVMKLKLPLRKRLGVMVIFALGAGASIAAAYKLGIFVEEMAHYISDDPTFVQYQMSRFIPGTFANYGKTFWIPSQVEPSVALIGASLPGLNHLVKTNMYLRKIFFVSSWSSAKKTSPSSGQPTGPVRDMPIVDRANFHALNDSEVELRNVT